MTLREMAEQTEATLINDMVHPVSPGPIADAIERVAKEHASDAIKQAIQNGGVKLIMPPPVVFPDDLINLIKWAEERGFSAGRASAMAERRYKT